MLICKYHPDIKSPNQNDSKSQILTWHNVHRLSYVAFLTRFRKKHIFRNKQYGIIPEQALNNLVKDPSKRLIFNFSSEKQWYNFFWTICNCIWFICTAPWFVQETINFTDNFNKWVYVMTIQLWIVMRADICVVWLSELRRSSHRLWLTAKTKNEPAKSILPAK